MIHLVSKQNAAKATGKIAPALQLQTSPPVYVIVVSGEWLLKHTTPSWRIKDPIKGFQRIVNEARARQIARTVLDQERAFPNAITLATDTKDFKRSGNDIVLPSKSKFLVVDGQHRLWAPRFPHNDDHYYSIFH